MFMKNIGCWRDKTWCASPNCKNECGRKMPPDVKSAADNCTWPISYAYFCGELEACQHESDNYPVHLDISELETQTR